MVYCPSDGQKDVKPSGHSMDKFVATLLAMTMVFCASKGQKDVVK